MVRSRQPVIRVVTTKPHYYAAFQGNVLARKLRSVTGCTSGTSSRVVSCEFDRRSVARPRVEDCELRDIWNAP